MSAAILLIPLLALTASGPEPKDASDMAGRKAIQSGASSPWYDSKSDSVRRVDVPDSLAYAPGKLSRWNWNWSLGFFEILKYLVWGLIIAVLAGLAYFLIRTYLGREERLATGQGDLVETRGTLADRVERLPIPVRSQLGDLLGEARYHYEHGNFREAIIYLYSHELVELDKQQVIQLARGKTNRQYLRELRSRHSLRELLEQTMVTFEDAFFGKRDIGRERFEKCWHRLSDFNAMLGVALA